MAVSDTSVKQGNTIAEAGYIQRREWVAYKVREDNYPYNTSIKFEVSSFSQVTFQKAIDAMIERHEILRTTLQVIDGTLKQVIHPSKYFSIPFTLTDVCSFEEKERDDFVTKKVSLSTRTPFNLESGPLFRVEVFKKRTDLYNIYFIIHHLIFDLHSFQVFKKDLTQFWKMFTNDFFEPVTSNVIQYKEYAAFENELLENKNNAHRLYWEEKLAEGLPRLLVIDEKKWEVHREKYIALVNEVKTKMDQLPFSDDRVIAGVLRKYKANAAGYLSFNYTNDLTKSIQKYNEQGRNGILSLLIAGIAITFNKLSGQRTFVFDVPASSRANIKYKDTIGWLTTSGPCFISLGEDHNIPDLLDEIDEQLYLLSRHSVYPFEAIGSRFDPPVGGDMPVFLTLVTKNQDLGPVQEGMIFHKHRGTTTYQNLAIFIDLYNDAMTLNLAYDNFLFDASLIETITNDHAQVLSAIVRELHY